MTRDDLQKLFDAAKEADRVYQAAALKRDTLDGDLEYRRTMLAAIAADKAYQDAAQSFVNGQVAA